MSHQSVVLITGASSGVGQSTARLLSQRGFSVFGTSRSAVRADAIPGVEMLPLDVRSDDSVRSCVDSVSGRTARIDMLINNAGYELAGALEELSLDEARTQFETNLFGPIRMVNAVLPLMPDGAPRALGAWPALDAIDDRDAAEGGIGSPSVAGCLAQEVPAGS